MSIENKNYIDPILNLKPLKCSIIIPVFNNANMTKRALKHLKNLSNDYEIIIVNNGSIDHTDKVLNDTLQNYTEEDPRLVVVNSPRNLGFGRANNKGFKSAHSEFVIFLNNDIKVEERLGDWPEIILEAAQDGSIVCTGGGELDKKFGFVREGKDLPHNDYWYMSGWCVGARREVFEKLILNHYSDDKTDEMVEGQAWGPWNEKFFLYFEDGDLTWRAKELMIPIKEVSIPVTHIKRATGKRYNMFGWYEKSRKIFIDEWKEKYQS